MKVGDEVYIGYPSAIHYGTKGEAESNKGKTPVNQLLWGDWARIDQIDGSWFNVRSRGRSGWVRKENLQEERILEVNFVDIGQGDGCHIQTPEDKAIIVDAGEGDNMYRFLRWRFGKFANKFNFESFVITHPDKDHYYGFKELLEHDKVHVGTIYHNTIIEQVKSGKSTLGAEKKIDGINYLTGLVKTKTELKKRDSILIQSRQERWKHWSLRDENTLKLKLLKPAIMEVHMLRLAFSRQPIPW